MTKYIDADALMKKFSLDSNGNRMPEVDVDNFPITETLADIKQIIREMPAADVEPVRHGAWVDPDDDGGATEWHCSSCGHAIKTLFYPSAQYCPNCGAKMDGGADNEERK